MMKVMFKKVLFSLLTCAMISGCAHVVEEPRAVDRCTGGSCYVEKQQFQTVRGTGWSVELHENFIAKIDPVRAVRTEDGTRELVATTKNKTPVGRGPAVVVVVVVDLDSTLPPEKFGQAAVGALLSGDDVAPVGVKDVLLGDNPGTLSVVNMAHDVTLLQLAVGKGKKGYLLQCGGDAKERKRITVICSEVIKSFKLL